jgi:hypothetical protein
LVFIGDIRLGILSGNQGTPMVFDYVFSDDDKTLVLSAAMSLGYLLRKVE